ncbi:unnamed protein product [Polarella glacialis]|uniref:UDP-N-acetylglucosamine kinase n=1 Tax=Polarella glacialis TaxID=89957 RepID=A0A813G6N8_POLGL|nr:unnamed protein product [Polarella glacialis]CAE8693985.1 unnamed protein product [Polarella glacialis]
MSCCAVPGPAALPAEEDEGESLPDYFPLSGQLHAQTDALDQSAENEDEEICELIGFELDDTLERKLRRPFTDAERQAAYKLSGFDVAKSATRPSALWLIGPSACGKSTLAPQMASKLGMADEGYVVVDGEYFRDTHEGYLEALSSGLQKGCVWRGAYVGIRENINSEKQLLLEQSMREKKHMIIPSTCLRRSQCVDVAKTLQANGYDIHIVGVYGDKDTIVSRGRKRAMTAGKRYEPREFEIALTMFAPMLRLCTGEWHMVCTTGDVPFRTTGHGHGPLSEPQVKEICEDAFSIFHA